MAYGAITRRGRAWSKIIQNCTLLYCYVGHFLSLRRLAGPAPSISWFFLWWNSPSKIWNKKKKWWSWEDERQDFWGFSLFIYIWTKKRTSIHAWHGFRTYKKHANFGSCLHTGMSKKRKGVYMHDMRILNVIDKAYLSFFVSFFRKKKGCMLISSSKKVIIHAWQESLI